MIAAFGDLDVGAGAGRGEDARGEVGVEVLGERGGGAIPGGSGEAALLLAEVAFGAGGQLGAYFGGVRVLVDGGGGAGDEVVRSEDVEGRVEGGQWGLWVEAGGDEDSFELAGADDGVDFGDVLADLVAVALDEAACDDEALGVPFTGAAVGDCLHLDHLEDSVDGLLLGGVDEGASVDDEDFGVFGVGGELAAGVMEEAHHDFGVDEILGAAEGDETDLRPVGGTGYDRSSGGWFIEDGGGSHRLLF